MSATSSESEEGWNAAMPARLHRLKSMPVDTSRLARAVAAELEPDRGTTSRSWWRGAARPMRAVAASLVLTATIVAAVMLTASSGAVYAEPAEMAAMHRELISGKGSMMKVNSVDAANRMLSSEWNQSPELPDIPEKHLMACCLRQMGNKKIVCVLLNDGGTPVSMMVAGGHDVKSSRGTTVVKDGMTYEVSSSGDLNMVMSKRNGRWVCLIGERSAERLMDLSSGIRF